MGKGDKRSRRGKIFAGSHGKTRPKYKKEVLKPSAESAAATTQPAAEKVRKPKVRKKKADEEAAA